MITRQLTSSSCTHHRITVPDSLSPAITPSAFHHLFTNLTNPFLHSLFASIWTAFMDLELTPDLFGTDVCLF